ncbi:SGS domain-containing protein [Flammula alnicola]|nr:SGS domain-containing protein [Flammula alnicola]
MPLVVSLLCYRRSFNLYRHEFYETDEKLTLSIFDRGADPAEVSINFEPRKFTYTHGEKSLVLEPLKGQIDPDASDYTVGKVKIEIRLIKRAHGRWGSLTGDSPDPLTAAPTVVSSPEASTGVRKPQKNWDALTTTILSSDKEKSVDEDPNVGGDSTLNGFFQKIFGDADEDTKRAMMKSYSESGGTTLSTNWDEVKKGKVEVKPPSGSEWKKWN